MKLARFRTADVSRWGRVDVERGLLEHVSGTLGQWAPRLVDSSFTDLPLTGERTPLAEATLLEPLEDSAKVLGVGANYWAHLERLGRTERPQHLASFLKPRTAVIAHGEQIRWPQLTATLDYEVELVAVVGRPVTPLSTDSESCLLGYTVGNDVSARDQRNDHGPDLISMKANDATTPLGPWITTVDELGSPRGLDLTIRCSVNGEVRQQDSTSKMLWSLPEILEFFRVRISLAPGDVIFTGTTCGVGMEDGRYLEADDVVETEVVGIGVLRNSVGPRGQRG